MRRKKRRKSLNSRDFRFNDGSYKRFLEALFQHLEGVQREHALLKTYQHVVYLLSEGSPDGGEPTE